MRFTALLGLVLLCSWAIAAGAALALPYEPIFHVRPPRFWVGAPSAPYRDASTSTSSTTAAAVHLYMQYNPTAAVASSDAWYHVTSTDYIHWNRVATPATALSAGAWFDANGVLSGVLMANNLSTPVVMYTCAGSSAVQLQCMAHVSTTTPAAASSSVASAWDFNTLVKSSNDPVIAPGEVPGLVSGGYFRDPTEWWTDPASSTGSSSSGTRWLIGFATRISDNNGTRAHVVAFATTDPSYQTGYRYSHSLYVDNFTGGTATFEHPDFFPVTQGGERYLKLSLLEQQQDVVLYGTYAANASSGQYVFTASTTRRATYIDYGVYYGAKTFYDAVLRVRRVWGWIREELTAAAMEANGWGGLQTIRGVVYDSRERRLRFPPISELQSLRKTLLTSRQLVSLTEDAPLTLYTGSSSIPKYQEIIATFYVPSTLFDGTQYFATAPPEFGVRVRMSPDASHYVSISVRMPATNATATRGYAQSGRVIRQFAVGEDSSTGAAQCRAACTALARCEAWNVRMNVSGVYCDLLSTSAPLTVDCAAQTSRPNVPLLVVDRATSTTAGFAEVLSGRAPLTNAHAGYVKLHIFIDDSVIEVYKDDGMEVISSRVYVADASNMTGASLFVRNLNGQSDMLADVTAYTMSSIWPSASSSSSPSSENN